MRRPIFFPYTLEKWYISTVSLCSPFVYRCRLESRYTVEMYRVFIRVNDAYSKVFCIAACKDAFFSHLSALSSSSPNTPSINFTDLYGSIERPFSGWRNRLPFLRHWSLARIVVTEICHESSIMSSLTGLEITIARVSGLTIPRVYSCI